MSAERTPALAYLRVSTERQAGEQVTSLSDQEKALAALAKKLGVSIVQAFRDEGASGATIEARPAFLELLAYCTAHPRPARAQGAVLVLNASRWGRFDDPDQAAALRFQLRQAGWIVRFAESDVEGDDTIARSVIRAVGDAQASEYRRNIIRNAQRGKRGASELGWWTSREPYGYRRAVAYPPDRARVLAPGQRKAPDEKVKLTPHAEEAAVVRWMFDEFGSGRRTLGALTDSLNERTPGRRWSRAVLRVMLMNRAYLGEIVAGRRSGALWRQRVWKTDPSTWLHVPDAHPAIVSADAFDAVQRRLATHTPRPREGRLDYLVTGLVSCAVCGRPFIGGGVGGRFADGSRNFFYRCSGIDKGDCPGKVGNVSKHLLERALIEAMAKELRHPTVRAAIRRATEELITPENRDTERRALAVDIERMERRRDRLVQAVADGTMTAEEARTTLESTRQAIVRLRGEYEQAPMKVDAATVRAQREQLSRFALDFKRVAAALNGPKLREVIGPWLQSATFNKHTRELALRVRTVPVSLIAAHSPGRVFRQQIREVRVTVGPLGRRAVGNG